MLEERRRKQTHIPSNAKQVDNHKGRIKLGVIKKAELTNIFIPFLAIQMELKILKLFIY